MAEIANKQGKYTIKTTKKKNKSDKTHSLSFWCLKRSKKSYINDDKSFLLYLET